MNKYFLLRCNNVAEQTPWVWLNEMLHCVLNTGVESKSRNLSFEGESDSGDPVCFI